jgi:hypothetical protein
MTMNTTNSLISFDQLSTMRLTHFRTMQKAVGPSQFSVNLSDFRSGEQQTTDKMAIIA